MPFASYLEKDLVLMLAGVTREAVLGELVDAVCRRHAELDCGAVLQAVLQREDELNTRIAPDVALPHARIVGLDSFVVAVGLSPRGIDWGRELGGHPVRIVVLVLGDARRADEHIRVLGQIAARFSQPGLLDRLMACREASDLFGALLTAGEANDAGDDAWAEMRSQALLDQASKLARRLGAGTVIVLGPRHMGRWVARLRRRAPGAWVLAAPATPAARAADDAVFDEVINVPSPGLSGHQRVDVVILIGLLNGILKREGIAVCVYGREETNRLDTVHVADLQRQFGELLVLSDEIRRSDIEPEVLYRVLQLASELANEGREGHPVGTLFALGDYKHVAAFSHQIVVNPFRGYAAAEKNLLDPSLQETIKEFSLLDGAFVVRGDGEVMSAGTCLQIGAPAELAVSGLGTRHAAGVAISAATDALAIVLSQSTGTVSVYKSGRCILKLSRRGSNG